MKGYKKGMIFIDVKWNGYLMSCLRTTKALLLSLVLAVTSCSDQDTKTSELDDPISAKTVEACIDEIQCAWDYFKNLAFGAEFGYTGIKPKGEPKVFKWNRKDRMVISPGSSPHYTQNKALVDKLISKIHRHTGLDITLFEGVNSRANVFILFEPDIDKGLSEGNKNTLKELGAPQGWFEEQLAAVRKHDQTDTFTAIFLREDLSISGAVIFIKEYEDNDLISVSFIEEIIQTTGFSNDYQKAPFTRFNDQNDKFWPTALDWFLLTLFYNDSIKPGMTMREVKGVFAQIYEQTKTIINQEIKPR